MVCGIAARGDADNAVKCRDTQGGEETSAAAQKSDRKLFGDEVLF